MSSTIQQQLAHRSIRQFTAQPLSQTIINELVDVARQASTSNHLQCVSIIRITDPQKRATLMGYCANQPYVKDAPEFWVFCADFHKHKQICPEVQLDWAEVLLIGSIDAGIMAQNVLVAAESLGLGGVYIGSLRNQMAKAGELLNLPVHTLPLFGMCLGYPDQNPPLKPRLSANMMFFENEYQTLDQTQLNEYDKTVADYYQNRSQIDMNWSKNVEKVLAQPVRPHVLAYLQQQGFVKK